MVDDGDPCPVNVFSHRGRMGVSGHIGVNGPVGFWSQ